MFQLSYKILRFNFYQSSLITYINTPAGIIRYGLTPPQVAAITAFTTLWTGDFRAYVSPITNSTVTINAINGDYQIGFTLLQSIRAQVKGNTTITLSAEEKAVFNISNPGSITTSKGIPKYAPAITCVGLSPLTMLLVALYPPVPFKRGKQAGVSAIGFKIALTDVGAPPPALTDYVRQENETNTEFEMLFTSAQVGKMLYIIGFYINSANVAGKDGIPYIIQIM